MKPLVILAFFDETFVAVLLLLDYEPADKLPCEPSVAGGRAFGKPGGELLRIVIVEVTQTNERVRCEFAWLTGVDRLRRVENLICDGRI